MENKDPDNVPPFPQRVGCKELGAVWTGSLLERHRFPQRGRILLPLTTVSSLRRLVHVLVLLKHGTHDQWGLQKGFPIWDEMLSPI
jgi:hypothetical protein